VLGRGKYGTPWTKYQEMLGLTVGKVESEAMEWGIKLQPLVGQKWSEATGLRVRACNWTYWHPDIDRVYSHYDYDVPPNAILEVKTAGISRADEWGEEDTDQVPEPYLLQAQHELMCRPDREACHIAVLIGGQRFRKYRVPRDAELIGLMEQGYREFLGRVDRAEPPEIDGSASASEYLRSMYPADNGEEVELDDRAEELARRYLSAKAEIEERERELFTYRNALLEWIADRAVARGNGYSVSCKQERARRAVDWPAVEKAHPEIIAPYVRTEPGHRPLVVRFRAP
jgi:predicted phage-related endonuclease